MSNRARKKRNKKYTGVDAAVTKKTVTRFSAPERSRFAEWWHDNRQVWLFRSVLGGLVLIATLIIWGIASFLF